MSISIPLNGGLVSSLLLITTTFGAFLLCVSLPQLFRGTEGGCVDFVVHPGAIGDQWLSDIRPAECSQANSAP